MGGKGGSGIMVAQYNEEVAHWLRHQTYSSRFESGPLNVYTGQKPRRPVVFIEIEPNAYNNYLSQTAGVISTFFGVIYFSRF